ncbi:MAG: zf-HC2 domain-containing protein [Planctomycetes bacterium]|nr:zf-HC2 domain-containing protein [Planctomycetota bacterium]
MTPRERRAPTCDEILMAILDGDFSELDPRDIDAHIEACPACRKEAAALIRGRALVAAAERHVRLSLVLETLSRLYAPARTLAVASSGGREVGQTPDANLAVAVTELGARPGSDLEWLELSVRVKDPRLAAARVAYEIRDAAGKLAAEGSLALARGIATDAIAIPRTADRPYRVEVRVLGADPEGEGRG